MLLLRVRYEIAGNGGSSSFAEERVVLGIQDADGKAGDGGGVKWLGDDEVLHILNHAKPEANIPKDMKRVILEDALEIVSSLDKELSSFAEARANVLKDAHVRVRKLLEEGSVRIKPVKPLDVLGVYVLVPV